MAMKESNSEIEELEKSLDEMRGMWMNALNETEALKQELELYKNLAGCRARLFTVKPEKEYIRSRAKQSTPVMARELRKCLCREG